MSFVSCSKLANEIAGVFDDSKAYTDAAVANAINGIPRATDTTLGVVELNQGGTGGDSTDNQSALTANGINTLLNSTAIVGGNATQKAVVNAVEIAFGADAGAQQAVVAGIVGNPAAITLLTTSLDSATTVEQGIIRIATAAEVGAASDSTTAIAPANLAEALNASVVGGNNMQKAVVNAVEQAIGADQGAQDAIADAIKEEVADAIAADAYSLGVIVDAIPSATTTVQGKVALATNGEAITGTDDEKALTPASGKAAIDAAIAAADAAFPVATTTEQGKVALATDAEAIAGTDATKAMTPAAAKAATDAAIAAAFANPTPDQAEAMATAIANNPTALNTLLTAMSVFGD